MNTLLEQLEQENQRLKEDYEKLIQENKKLSAGKIEELLIDDRWGLYEIEYIERLREALQEIFNEFLGEDGAFFVMREKIKKALEKE